MRPSGSHAGDSFNLLLVLALVTAQFTSLSHAQAVPPEQTKLLNSSSLNSTRSSALDPSSAKVDGNVSWRYMYNGKTAVNNMHLRIWNRAFLQRGVSIEHSEQLFPVIQRLRSGLPIAAIGLGSSLVAYQSGCYWRSYDHVLQFAHQIRGFGYWAWPHECLPGRGFMGLLMTDINSRYPHPDHIYLNMGHPGATVHHFARNWCFDSAIPKEVDIVLVEQHESHEYNATAETYWANEGRVLEEIWAQLSRRGRGGAPPAFLIVSAQFVVAPYVGPLAPPDVTFDQYAFEHSKNCVRDRCVSPSCSNFTTTLFNNSGLSDLGNAAEDEHSGVVHWYGWSEISTRNILLSLLRDRPWNKTDCEYATLINADNIHLSETGQLLLADTLVDMFHRAEAAYEIADSSNWIRPPWRPVNEGAWDQHHSCFGDGKPLNVSAELSHGFVYTDEGRHKPGWVSWHANDTLTLSVNTSVKPQSLAGESVTLTIGYLRSYKNMSVAAYGCSGTCACDPGSIDSSTHARMSVEEFHSIPVTQSVNCTLQIVNTLDERKFKLLGVTVDYGRINI